MGIFIEKDTGIVEAVKIIKQSNSQLYSGIVMQHTRIFNLIWKNPNFTPKQIIDGFGTDAVALFTLSSALQDMAESADSNYVRLAPPSQYSIIPNEDGTVKIIDV